MEKEKTIQDLLFKKTGLNRNSIIGNSKRSITISNSYGKRNKRRNQRKIYTMGNCAGCSRRRRS